MTREEYLELCEQEFDATEEKSIYNEVRAKAVRSSNLNNEIDIAFDDLDSIFNNLGEEGFSSENAGILLQNVFPEK